VQLNQQATPTVPAGVTSGNILADGQSHDLNNLPIYSSYTVATTTVTVAGQTYYLKPVAPFMLDLNHTNITLEYDLASPPGK
jgi:hypothetical protein